MDLVYIIFALVMALTLHEFAHAWMSDYLGDRTARSHGRLSINPLVHIDPIMTVLLPIALIVAHSPVLFGAARPVPFNPWAVRYGRWGAALVAAAGPLMNLLLACFFALWLQLFPVGALAQLFIAIIAVNVGFMVFNLMPIPPLDGSRVVYAAIPQIRGLFDAIEQNGLILIFVLLIFAGPLLTGIIGPIVAAILSLLIPGLTGLST
ncbi:MAG TPA: site-2 protease family protein [Candidatus Saccharimonadales bacterium]|nr:site-2 protease family protein [Candidatus Saccharimonadales bacterium]